VPLVAVRSAKFEPSEIPEIVEFCSWLLPMVVVETKPPEPLEAISVFGDKEETARFVVVAEVPVAFWKVKVVRVEEAFETKPPAKPMVVEVACSPVPSLVKGQGKEEAPETGQEVRQSPERQMVPEAKVVVVALVVVELEAVKFVRVDEALERKPPINSKTVEVACSPPACLVKGQEKERGDEFVRVPFERERPEPIVKAPIDPSGKA
jgi:hypothetical protein